MTNFDGAFATNFDGKRNESVQFFCLRRRLQRPPSPAGGGRWGSHSELPRLRASAPLCSPAHFARQYFSDTWKNIYICIGCADLRYTRYILVALPTSMSRSILCCTLSVHRRARVLVNKLLHRGPAAVGAHIYSLVLHVHIFTTFVYTSKSRHLRVLLLWQ